MAEWYKFWNRNKKNFKRKGFDGAGSNRLMNDFVGGNTRSLDDILKNDIRKLRDRCRDLSRNNEFVRRYINLMKTNVIGSDNIVKACLDTRVKKVIALSTDKAAAPVNLYGATKLCADKLFIAANNITGKNDISFSLVRYGNVMGSRGSVIPHFLKLRKTGTLPITNKEMTRFNISLQEGVEMVKWALNTSIGGEIFVPKIPSYRITELAEAIAPKCKLDIIGTRPGEKIHEQMIGIDDSHYTYEYRDYYKILPAINNWDIDKKRIKNGKKVANGFVYGSDNKDDLLSKTELKKWLKTYKK